MKIFKSIEQFVKSKTEIKSFVPTMGNLHEGHSKHFVKFERPYMKI